MLLQKKWKNYRGRPRSILCEHFLPSAFSLSVCKSWSESRRRLSGSFYRVPSQDWHIAAAVPWPPPPPPPHTHTHPYVLKGNTLSWECCSEYKNEVRWYRGFAESSTRHRRPPCHGRRVPRRDSLFFPGLVAAREKPAALNRACPGKASCRLHMAFIRRHQTKRELCLGLA